MAFEQIPKKDWYSILGADPSENVSDLKQKYQKLILKYHPDKQSTDVPAGTVEECLQKFIEVDQAWKILGNEETKKEYDLQRHGRFLGLEPQSVGIYVKRSLQPSSGAFSSICTQLLPPFLLHTVTVFNYALFFVMIIVYPLRS
uniref:DnaJ heat shock protein family (Hsp40) member C24 n=1 Tax=Oryctolagus cuniculus TaxID=9986 RepID=A0A5F9CFD5_RABIT